MIIRRFACALFGLAAGFASAAGQFPAKAPPDRVNALNADFVWALGIPEIRARMIDLGYEPVGNTAAEFANFVREQLARYQKIIQDTGIQIE